MDVVNQKAKENSMDDLDRAIFEVKNKLNELGRELLKCNDFFGKEAKLRGQKYLKPLTHSDDFVKLFELCCKNGNEVVFSDFATQVVQDIKNLYKSNENILRIVLKPISFDNKAKEFAKGEYLRLRTVVSVYGNNSIEKASQDYSFVAKDIEFYSLFAFREAVNFYAKPRPEVEGKKADYSLPAIGELKKILEPKHIGGLTILNNLNFICNLHF